MARISRYAALLTLSAVTTCEDARMQTSSRSSRTPLLVAAAAILGLAAIVSPAQAGSSNSESNAAVTVVRAPKLKDVNRTATVLATRFLTLLEQNNVRGLKSFLSPSFQLQRADGSSASKANYLSNLPRITSFEISDLRATQAGAALVVTYKADIEGMANDKPYSPGAAPRLSTFTWNGRLWQLTSHANFNSLEAPLVAGSVPLLAKARLTVLDQLVAYPLDTQAEVSVTVLTLNEGSQTGWHRHDAPMVAYIMQGSVTVTYDGGVVKTYSEGEAILEAVGTRHNGLSTGPGPVVILVINMGAEGVANTVML